MDLLSTSFKFLIKNLYWTDTIILDMDNLLERYENRSLS